MTTTTNSRPFILVVDDKPDDLRSDVELGLDDHAAFNVRHPRDVAIKNLEEADLVLVDYVLDNWPELDSQECIGLKPITGMALAAILREHVDRSNKDRRTAFALHSAHIDDIRGRVPAKNAQHVLARLRDLEWAFPKTEPRRYDQMVILAEAVSRLPREWPDQGEDSTSQLKSLLHMDEEASWFDRCWREVQECQPPIHDLRSSGHGLLLIRWLLHQVMPYPTFLWEDHWAAARLHLPVDEFRTVIAEETQLSQDLKARRYSGILAGFLKDRWWRGALEDYIWDLAGGGSGDAEALRVALQERARKDLRFVEPNSSVVCLDQDFEPTGNFTSPAKALRLRPDHWPAFADAAWMDLETVLSNPTLAAMVDPFDQDRIGGEEEE